MRLLGWLNGSLIYAPLPATLLEGCGEGWDSGRTAEGKQRRCRKRQQTTLAHCLLLLVESSSRLRPPSAQLSLLENIDGDRMPERPPMVWCGTTHDFFSMHRCRRKPSEPIVPERKDHGFMQGSGEKAYR
jgi:hypothetical protein